MRFANNPPKVAITDAGGRPTPEFYRWMASVTRMTGASDGPFETSQFLTLAVDADLGAERVMSPVAGQLTGTDGGAGSTYTLGLANTAVTAGSYGGAGSLVSFTVDAKGRLTAASSVAGADLTKVDDTNVTLTLGGTPTASLLKGVSLTLGWTGTLSVARGGTGGGVASGTLLDNISGFASTGHVVRTGAGAYAFRTVTGTANQIDVANGSGVAGNPTISISVTYAGQTSITTLGTIATGTWQGSIIAGQYGGTGVANTGKTITLGGNLTTSGAFACTFTLTNTTSVTLPTTGTLATLAGAETLTNKTITGPVMDAVPSAAWGIDFAPSTSANNYITIANNGTYDLTGGSGLIAIYDDAGGGAALIITWFGTTTILSQNGTLFTTTLGTVGNVNVAYNGTTAYRIENKSGGSKSFFISTIRFRTTT